MDLSTIRQELEEATRRAVAMAEQLREDVNVRFTDGKTAILVRPVMFEQPGIRERDPVFGMTYQDWLRWRAEGFDGWMETTEGSRRPKIMIHTEKAEQFFLERIRRQRAVESRPSTLTTKHATT